MQSENYAVLSIALFVVVLLMTVLILVFAVVIYEQKQEIKLLGTQLKKAEHEEKHFDDLYNAYRQEIKTLERKHLKDITRLEAKAPKYGVEIYHSGVPDNRGYYRYKIIFQMERKCIDERVNSFNLDRCRQKEDLGFKAQVFEKMASQISNEIYGEIKSAVNKFLIEENKKDA